MQTWVGKSSGRHLTTASLCRFSTRTSLTSREELPAGFTRWRTTTILWGEDPAETKHPILRTTFQMFLIFHRLYRVYGKKNIRLESVPAKGSSLDPRWVAHLFDYCGFSGLQEPNIYRLVLFLVALCSCWILGWRSSSGEEPTPRSAAPPRPGAAPAGSASPAAPDKTLHIFQGCIKGKMFGQSWIIVKTLRWIIVTEYQISAFLFFKYCSIRLE